MIFDSELRTIYLEQPKWPSLGASGCYAVGLEVSREAGKGVSETLFSSSLLFYPEDSDGRPNDRQPPDGRPNLVT